MRGIIGKIFNCRKKQSDVSVVRHCVAPKVPKGWYVSDAGQNPLHMLWYVVLVNFDDVVDNVENPRYFFAEKCDSFDDALQECIEKMKMAVH